MSVVKDERGGGERWRRMAQKARTENGYKERQAAVAKVPITMY